MNTQFFVNGKDMQIKLESIEVGENLQLAPKDKIKVGSIRQRLIAVYRQETVIEPNNCNHTFTLCTLCASSWCEDFLIRRFRHGTISSYRTYGCRCGLCKMFPRSE